MFLLRAGLLVLLATSSLAAQTQAAQQPNPSRPTLFVLGDLPFSAIQNTFDSRTLRVVEGPANGQTVRTFIHSGTWDQLTAQMKSGDFVLIGFKPGADAGPAKLASDPTAAASLTFDGTGDSTFDYLDPGTHQLEHVHNYGWYLRKLVVDTINHGATPIVCYPPVPRAPTSSQNNPYLAYPAWIIHAIATEERVPYLDLKSAGVNPAPEAIRDAIKTLRPDPLEPYLKSATQAK